MSILLAVIFAAGTACGNGGGVGSTDRGGEEAALETVSFRIEGMT